MNAKTCKKMRYMAKKVIAAANLPEEHWKKLYKQWKKEVRNAPNT